MESKNFSPKIIDWLFSHYCQNPTYAPKSFLDLITYIKTEKLENANEIIRKHGLVFCFSFEILTSNFYLDKETAFLETEVSIITCKCTVNSTSSSFDGTIKSLYKLTEKGFEFQKIILDGEIADYCHKILFNGRLGQQKSLNPIATIVSSSIEKQKKILPNAISTNNSPEQKSSFFSFFKKFKNNTMVFFESFTGNFSPDLTDENNSNQNRRNDLGAISPQSNNNNENKENEESRGLEK